MWHLTMPLKAARRDANAHLKCFEDLGHQWPNFDGCIYIHYAAPLYSAPFTSFRLVWQSSVDDDDEIAYFTVRWKTRASFVYRTKNMR